MIKQGQPLIILAFPPIPSFDSGEKSDVYLHII